jgi:polyferredoxin
MEEERSSTRKIYEQVEQYAKTTIELYKLKVTKTVADSFAAVATGFVLWVLLSMFLLFLSIGAGFYFGEVLGGWHYGFFIVAGFYALIAIIIYIYRVKCLKDNIANFIIKQIFKD